MGDVREVEPGAADGAEPIGFEEALEGLERAVAALEAGDLGLDAALARYEESVRLLGRCRTLLDGAERKVALLSGVDDAGRPATEPFEAATAAERGAMPPASPEPARARTTLKVEEGCDEDVPF